MSNEPAIGNAAYVPAKIEHVANSVTHAVSTVFVQLFSIWLNKDLVKWCTYGPGAA